MADSKIKTRILIISDTHGVPFEHPSISPDVVIHCGDLTDGSLLSEFDTTIALFTSINAP
jgi:predicted phosphodiesterase